MKLRKLPDEKRAHINLYGITGWFESLNRRLRIWKADVIGSGMRFERWVFLGTEEGTVPSAMSLKKMTYETFIFNLQPPTVLCYYNQGCLHSIHRPEKGKISMQFKLVQFRKKQISVDTIGDNITILESEMGSTICQIMISWASRRSQSVYVVGCSYDYFWTVGLCLHLLFPFWSV